MAIAEVCRILESVGADYALIGAHAMAVRGYPRATVDVDFLTTDQVRPDIRPAWRELLERTRE